MIPQLDYCYHTHTERCGHAYGSDEEFVQAAIKAGIKVLGFTDHIFLPGIMQPGIRGHFGELDGYIASLLNLKDKYQDQIEIHIGFEAEYYPQLNHQLQMIHDYPGIEYFILGQHCFLNDDHELEFYLRCTKEDLPKRVKQYRDNLIEGIESGMFAYVAHPDMFMSGYPHFDEFAQAISRSIIAAAIKADIPLEINLGGARRGLKDEFGQPSRYIYPVLDFWRLAAQMGAKAIVGVDAHNPHDFTNQVLLVEMQPFWDLNLEFITRLRS